MYPYMNEDVAWQRLQDLQREMENSRLLAQNGSTAVARLAQYVGGRVRRLVAWARRSRQAEPLVEDRESATDAA